MTKQAPNPTGGLYRPHYPDVEAIFYDGSNTDTVITWFAERGAKGAHYATSPDGTDLVAFYDDGMPWRLTRGRWALYEAGEGFDIFEADDFDRHFTLLDGEAA